MQKHWCPVNNFNLPETCINSKLGAVIVNDPFHFFLEKKWSKKIGLRNKS